jgi:chromosome segregation ATPase
MPKLTDTFTLAFDCCDEVLRETGKFPTIDAVRSRIGVNSPNTIKNAINQWTEHFAKRHLEKLDRPSVPIALLDAVEKVWILAVKDAEQSYQTKELAMQQTVANKEEELAQAHEIAGLWETAMKQMEARFNALEQERAALLAESQALREEKDALTHAVAESQRALEQAGQLHAIEVRQLNNQQAQTEAWANRRIVEERELQIALAKEKLDHVKDQLQAAKEAKSQAENEAVHLRKTQSNLQKQVDTITKVMEEQRSQLDEREHTIQGLTETVVRLKQSVGSPTTQRILPKRGDSIKSRR